MEENRIRILAADDDPSILGVYRQVLAGPGFGEKSLFDPVFCGRAEDAVETIRSSMETGSFYAVAFLDVFMPPGKDGIWAAERIRELDPMINIVFVTGHIGSEMIEISKRITPQDKLLFLQKPFSIIEIWQLAAALSNKWLMETKLQAVQMDLEDQVRRRTDELMMVNRDLRNEIEQRKKAEEALKISEQNYRSIIMNNADGIIVLDTEGIIRFANPAAKNIFGSQREDILGKPFSVPQSASTMIRIDPGVPGEKGRMVEVRAFGTEWKGEKASLVILRDVTKQKKMERQIRSSMRKVEKTMKDMVAATAMIVESRDPYTAGHQRRVAEMARGIARVMEMEEHAIEGLYLAGMIHDTGKISIPAEILSKPGKLDRVEFELIKTHSQRGYDILKHIEFPWPIALISYQHHERINGSGYPLGLLDKEIMIEARILAVADVLEAMAYHRPYRPGLGFEKALEEIISQKGILFDNEVVEACVEYFHSNKKFFEDMG